MGKEDLGKQNKMESEGTSTKGLAIWGEKDLVK